MEESIYKHNYEYLSIEEAKAIVNGTFVQGTTNIGGELATKSDIGKLLDTVNKKLTSIVPSTEFDNEFICFFECEDIETFPDDLEHRWIEVSPIQFTFPADGGSVKITGSYGLTGTLGTRKKVGDIADTITADANATPSTKSGSKTYYYNNDQSQRPTAEVSWTQPNKEEEFPEEWTYVFEYNISDTNGGSSTGTSWSRQYYANGQEIKHADDITLNGITSYRTKTGTFGTVKKENVQYSGQIGRPSGYNYSDKAITQNGRLAQQGSNKQLQWSYTQEANVKVWGISAYPTSLHFEAAGGTQSVSVTTWYTWQYNNNNNQKFDQNTTTENITAEANTLQQQKTWTKVITKNNKSVSIQCTQEGAQEQFPDNLEHRWIRVQPESSQISVDGGTINVTGSYGLTGTYGTEKKIGDITDTIVVESNSTQNQKSGSKTYHYNNNQSDTPTAKITWTQPGRAEEFPDDEAHRWIEITPTNAGNFTEAGGTITVTGSYGLTGSFGTKKTVGQINDTITVEKNTATQTKSGSKTYYYNNTPGTAPSATVTWTQDAHAIITPTSVHVTNIILKVGQHQQIQYEVTPSNAVVDTCIYEVTSGLDYVHITDGVVYADAVGEAICKININGTIESTFAINVINDNTVRFAGDVFVIKNTQDFRARVLFYDNDHMQDLSSDLQENEGMIYPACYIKGLPTSVWTGTDRTMLIDLYEIKKVYQKIKNKPSLIKGKTIEQACEMNGGHYVKVEFFGWSGADGVDEPFSTQSYNEYVLAFKRYSNSSITYEDRLNKRIKLNNYEKSSEKTNFSYTKHYGGFESTQSGYWGYNYFDGEEYSYSKYKKTSGMFTDANTCIGYILIDVDAKSQSIFTFVSNGSWIREGCPLYTFNANKPDISITTNSIDTSGDIVNINLTINSVNKKTDITSIRGGIYALCLKDGQTSGKRLFGYDENGAYCWFNQINTLPYTAQINIPKEDYKKIQLKTMYYDASEERPVRYASEDTPLINEITL